MARPKEWDAEAHDHWTAGRKGPAVARTIEALNASGGRSADLALQAAYYLFLGGDYGLARMLLEQARTHNADHQPLLLNLAVLQSRTGAHADARATLERYLDLGGTDVGAYDGLCAACHKLGDDEAARRYGRLAIEAKTQEGDGAPLLPLGAARDGTAVISFSLWGANPRYLRGALHNAVRAPAVYPTFRCRFYVDGSVPSDLLAALKDLGAELIREDGDPTARHRLTRRFLVADDPAVGRYLVRDCDSLVNAREAAAVGLWIDSGKPFHVMRDWWTHTDPILAGMWGGVGGSLPPLAPMLADYRPKRMETPNWDQWFLRDRLWRTVRPNALVHDRLFGPEGGGFPGLPPRGNLHVGQDEYAVRRQQQADELAPFARTVPSLGL